MQKHKFQQKYWEGPLTRECYQLLDQEIRPTLQQQQLINQSLERLQQNLQLKFQGVQLLQFGSVASGLFLRNSCDMDLSVQLGPQLLQQMEELRLQECGRIMVDYEEQLADYELQQQSQQQTKDENLEKENEKEHLPRQLPTPTLPQIVIEQLGQFLQSLSEDYGEVLILPKTRIPVVKLKDLKTQLHIDLVFENLLAVENTRLLHHYAMVDQRFTDLALLVKYWTKRRSINDTYSGTLSSYAYLMMVVHFLQQLEPPVLPNLQTLSLGNGDSQSVSISDCTRLIVTSQYGTERTDDCWRQLVTKQQYNVYFWSGEVCSAEGGSDSQLGTLLQRFFQYYAHEFDFKESVISIRNGGLLTKEEKQWVPDFAAGGQDIKKEILDDDTQQHAVFVQESAVGKASKVQSHQQQQQRYWICIEDPFETTHNLGRPVGRDSLYFIRGEFLRASSVLCQHTNFSRDWKLSCERLHSWQDDRLDRMAPHLLQEVLQETEYKTREEHKQRNRENIDRGKRSKLSTTQQVDSSDKQ